MKVTSILFYLTAISFTLTAANSSNSVKVIEKHYGDESTSVPTYFEFSESKGLKEADLVEFLSDYIENNSFMSFEQVRVTKEDRLGLVHKVYQQHYRGIPIEYSFLRTHTKEGNIKSINGKIIHNSPSNYNINISEQKALEKALNFVGAETYMWELEEHQLPSPVLNSEYSYFPAGELTYIAEDGSADYSKQRLCYRFNVYAHKPMSRQDVYVDALNGEIVFVNNLIHTNNVPAVAKTAYSGIQNITTDSVSTSLFRLRQTKDGGGIFTWNMRRGTNYGAAVDFEDSDNYWDNVNSALDQYATDAHWGAEQTYSYFLNEHNRNSIDDNGFPLNSYVHYGVSYANANWNGQYMTYGDGGSTTTPFTTLDIAAHEITHGLTNYSANLIYRSESGALNESFSDIFGVAVEFYSLPNQANWTIGEDIGRAIRSMSNPKSFNNPDTKNGQYWVRVDGCISSNQNDYCGVHYNSGVQNYWFYLLVNGGVGTNDLGQTYSVSGIGMEKAASVAFRNLTVYLGRTSNYEDSRFYSIKSAIELFGSCSEEVEAVTDAWHAVGVGDRYDDRGVVSDFYTLDTVSCSVPYTVNFINKSANGKSFMWDFGNGITSTSQNPSVTYTTFGDFDVSLVINGDSCGVDTLHKTDYISISNSNMCSYILQAGSNPLIDECEGRIFDDGGANNIYSNNFQGLVTIAPSNAAFLTLYFNNFDVYSNSICSEDYIEVYDGESVNETLIGKYCNLRIPPDSIVTSGAVTLRFVSNSEYSADGFDLSWKCKIPVQSPQVDFEVNTDSTCSGKVEFYDLSSQAPNNWKWDFGDGNYSNLQNPTHTYMENGVYSVKLVAENIIGKDSIAKSSLVQVNRPEGALGSLDSVCVKSNAEINIESTGLIRWFKSERDNQHFHTGNNLTIDSLENDTMFWVEEVISGFEYNGGMLNNSKGNGGMLSGDYYLIFNAEEQLTIESVKVYPDNIGNATVELRNRFGTTINSKSFYVYGDSMTLRLDFDVAEGEDYQLGFSQNNNPPRFYANQTGASYPYSIGSKMIISGNNLFSLSYPFFYNIKLSNNGCISIRQKVKVVIDTICATSIRNKPISDIKIEVYPNPFNEWLQVNLPPEISKIEYKIYDNKGSLVKVGQLYEKNNKIEIASINSKGLYLIQFVTDEGVYQQKLIKY